MRAGAVPFQLEAKLKELGAKVEPADVNMENAVQDGTLITGQNHNSGRARWSFGQTADAHLVSLPHTLYLRSSLVARQLALLPVSGGCGTGPCE